METAIERLTEQKDSDPFKDSPLGEKGHEGAEEGQGGQTLGHLHCFVLKVCVCDNVHVINTWPSSQFCVRGRVTIGGLQFCAFPLSKRAYH